MLTAFCLIPDGQTSERGALFPAFFSSRRPATARGALFRRLWGKLLDAGILEAIAEAQRKPEKEPMPVTAESIREWFREADQGEISDRQEVPPRVRVETRRSGKSILFDTCDHGLGDAVLHRNLVTN